MVDMEQRLRDALHDDAARARLVNPDRPPARTDGPMPEAPPSWGRRPWLAVAAVIAVLALISAVTLLDDEPTVETGPATSQPVPSTSVPSGRCEFEIDGDPITLRSGAVDPSAPRFDTLDGQGVAHALLGSQVAEIHVPGFQLQDPDPWRMEDIELERGPAKVWLDGPESGPGNKPFVQVRYFPDTEQTCSSFTVTVDGGSEAENRATAIDLAERLVLRSEGADVPVAEVPEEEAPPPADPVTLPEPGAQPADPASAEAQVRAAYVGIFDASVPREERARLSERPNVWLLANEELSEGQYGSAVQDLQAEVEEVVFTTPAEAAVRFHLVASDSQVPQDSRIGRAVLLDGQWVVAIATTCDLVSIAGVQCDMTR